LSNITKMFTPSFINIVPVTHPDAYPYQVMTDNFYIIVDSSAEPTTIILPPAPQEGNRFVIKDGAGNSGSNAITIEGNGNTIDGEPLYVIQNDYGFVGVLFDGFEWKVINQ
jgi:hypothetical protein